MNHVIELTQLVYSGTNSLLWPRKFEFSNLRTLLKADKKESGEKSRKVISIPMRIPVSEILLRRIKLGIFIMKSADFLSYAPMESTIKYGKVADNLYRTDIFKGHRAFDPKELTLKDRPSTKYL